MREREREREKERERERGGLGLPSVTTMYKKQQVSRQVQLQTSRDPGVRKVAQQQLEVQRSMERVFFKPAEVAHSVIELDGNLCRKNLNRRARALVTTEEDEALSANLLSLPQQGRMMTQFGRNAAALWSRCINKLPPEPLSFILNATVESLPTNANLFKWGKRPSPSCALCHGERQSLLHVLNACPTAMSLRRYSARRDEVLQVLSAFVRNHLPLSFSMCTDLVEAEYAFPLHITPTNLRPDVVWWSDEDKAFTVFGVDYILRDHHGAGTPAQAGKVRGPGGGGEGGGLQRGVHRGGGRVEGVDSGE